MRLLFLVPLLFSTLLSAQLVGDKQSGLASYYSAEYNGAETAYGVIYDRNELVAAHKAYPFNSTVRVTNEENGKSVTVRIIDKGPFIRGRIIELSERAAREIGMLGQRTVPVELTLLSTPDQRPVRSSPTPATEPAPAPTPAAPPRVSTSVVTTDPEPPVPTPAAAPPTSSSATAATPAATSPRALPAQRTTPAPAPRRPKTFAPGLYHVRIDNPEAGRYGVQVGYYTALESAMDKVAELQGRYFDEILIKKETGATSTYIYKVILGPFRDHASAQNYAADLKRRYAINGFPVELDRP